MRALITGLGGQDGSYLAELLLSKGYEVYGLLRRVSSSNTSRIDHLLSQDALMGRRLFVLYGDMTDAGSLADAVRTARPNEVYNLAAMSHVGLSYKAPVATLDITGVSVARMLEAVKNHAPEAKFYQASSSEMFGKVQETPQTERTPFWPRSPYGVSKVAAFNLVRSYREGYGMFATNGILFNHESPRRGSQFLSKKVVEAAVRIKRGLQDKLFLGNLEAKRDWGSAKNYVYWIWRMMQTSAPDDFLIATGETHTVEEFVSAAFAAVELDWRKHVEVDPQFLRPAEVDLLLGDYSKAARVLGYQPKLNFRQLVDWMVAAELGVESPYENQWEA